MRPALASAVLALALCACGSSATFKSTKTYDRALQATPILADPLPDDAYTSPSNDEYRVRFSYGETRVEVSDGPLTELFGMGPVIIGTLDETKSTGVVRYYHVDNGFAGGRFILHANDEAELTLNGSGVPIVVSTRGILVRPSR